MILPRWWGMDVDILISLTLEQQRRTKAGARSTPLLAIARCVFDWATPQSAPREVLAFFRACARLFGSELSSVDAARDLECKVLEGLRLLQTADAADLAPRQLVEITRGIESGLAAAGSGRMVEVARTDAHGGRDVRGGELRCLIAEDEPVSSRVLELYLQPFGRTVTVPNGREAVVSFLLAHAAGDPFDLICLDIIMPELDGQRALQLIRRCELAMRVPLSESVKIVMTTGLAGEEQIARAFLEGSEAYLVKPIDRTCFLEVLEVLNLVREKLPLRA